MTGWLAAAAAAGALLLVLDPWVARGGRLAGFGGPDGREVPDGGPRLRGTRGGRVGRVGDRSAPEARSPRPLATGVIASLVVAAVGALVAGPLAAGSVALGAVVVAGRRRRRAAQAAEAAVVRALPDAVELIALAAAGRTPLGALRVTRLLLPPPIGTAVGAVVTAADRGVSFPHALEHLADHLGAPAVPLARALRTSAASGADAVPALRAAADLARGERRRAVEADLGRLPVRLLFPLVLLGLPSVGLLTVVPLLLSLAEGPSP